MNAVLDYPAHSANPRPWLLLFAALLALGILFGAHAVARHGDDATVIRDCLERDGPAAAFRFANSQRRANQVILCAHLQDGRWGLSLIERVWYGWRERTSFVPDGDGSYARLWEYLSAKNVTPVGWP